MAVKKTVAERKKALVHQIARDKAALKQLECEELMEIGTMVYDIFPKTKELEAGDVKMFLMHLRDLHNQEVNEKKSEPIGPQMPVL